MESISYGLRIIVSGTLKDKKIVLESNYNKLIECISNYDLTNL